MAPTQAGLTPTDAPLPAPLMTRVEDIPEPPRRDPIDLARRLVPDRYERYLQRDGTPKPTIKKGEVLDFNLILNDGVVTVSAIAKRVSENAYWFFDERSVPFNTEIDEAVQVFEDEIWPSVTGLFGPIRNPGIDGDRRLFILHTSLDPGLVGIFPVPTRIPVK